MEFYLHSLYKSFLYHIFGYFSYRSDASGSTFVQSFCRHLLNYYQKEDLVTIATLVKRDIASRSYFAKSFTKKNEHLCQMPYLISTLGTRTKLEMIDDLSWWTNKKNKSRAAKAIAIGKDPFSHLCEGKLCHINAIK